MPIVLLLTAWLLNFMGTAEGEQESRGDDSVASKQVRIRRPIAIESTHLANRLLVANSASGSLSVIDVSQPEPMAEMDLVEQAGGLAADQTKRFFLLTDRAQGRLHCLQFTVDSQVQPEWELETVGDCRAVEVSPGNSQIAVAGHWSRQVEFFSVAAWNAPPSGSRTVDLDFVPGQLCWLDDDQLLVLSAYDGQMVVVDRVRLTMQQRFVADHRFAGVALRADDKTLLLTDQLLNPLARSTRNDVFWGLMVANRVSELPVARLTGTMETDWLLSDSRDLGGPRNAKSDPGAIGWDPSYTLVALSGVDQLGVSVSDDQEFSFVETGRRPVDMVRVGSQALVVNMLDDSLTLVDLEELKPIKTISLGQAPERTLAQQGERLFFDGRLSLDGWMSCHSCHVEGHTNGLLNDNFSDGSFGTPKRVLSLLGKAGSAPFAWNGSSVSLQEQVRRSIESTMQSSHPADEKTVRAIVAYLRTLPVPPAIEAEREKDREPRGRIEQGEQLFHSLNCVQCHEPPHYTSRQNFDVGLSDEQGLRSFNPPVLLGLSQRHQFFHDNRAGSLREVLTDFRHQLTEPLSEEELQDLLAFLHSL